MADIDTEKKDSSSLFDISLKNAINKDTIRENYEKNSLKLVLSLIECSTAIQKNKIRISKLMVEKLDDFINQLNQFNTCSSDELKVKQDIREIQANIANYVIKGDKKEVNKLKSNLSKLNSDNKILIVNSKKQTDLNVEENDKLNMIISANQTKLHEIVKSTQNNEVARFFDNLKPANLDKLDLLYKMLSQSLGVGDNKEISKRRGILISELKLCQSDIEKYYKFVKVIDEMDCLLNKPTDLAVKQKNIKSVLLRKGNEDFENYFGDSVDNYIEFKKRFRNLYDYLDVKRLKLYKDALENELPKQREVLKERYSEEVLSAKIGPIQTFKISWPIVTELLKNTITERKIAKTGRKKFDRIKQELKDIGRILGLPFVSLYKLIIKIIQEGIMSIILSIIFFFTKFGKRKRKKDKKKKKKEEKKANKQRKEDEKKAKQELGKNNGLTNEKRKRLIDDYSVGEGLKINFDEVLSDVNVQAEKNRILEEEKRKEGEQNFSEAFHAAVSNAKESNKQSTYLELTTGRVILEDEIGINRTLIEGDITYSYKKTDEYLRCSIIDTETKKVNVFEQNNDGIISRVKFSIQENGELKQAGKVEDVSKIYQFSDVAIDEDNCIPCLMDSNGNYVAGPLEEELIDQLSKNNDNVEEPQNKKAC